MPRYFFNVHHESPSIDTVGKELPDKTRRMEGSDRRNWRDDLRHRRKTPAGKRMAVRGDRRIREPTLRDPCQCGTTVAAADIPSAFYY